MPPKKAPSKTKSTSSGDLQALTVVDLKKLAKQKNVSLVGITKKADIVKALSSGPKPKKPEPKKEKLKKSPQSKKKSPTGKKTTKMSKTAKSTKQWFVAKKISNALRPAKVLAGPFPSKEAALYYIFNEERKNFDRLDSKRKETAAETATRIIEIFNPKISQHPPVWKIQEENREYLIFKNVNNSETGKNKDVQFAQFKKMVTSQKKRVEQEEKEEAEREESEDYSDIYD